MRKLASNGWLLKEILKPGRRNVALSKNSTIGSLAVNPEEIIYGIPRKDAMVEYEDRRYDVSMKKPFVYLGEWSRSSLVQFSELITTKFVCEILSEVNIKDTSLYAHISTAGPISRSFGEINNENSLRRYADYILRMSEWVEWKRGKCDDEVLDLGPIYCSVARDEICFLKNGNHRLAIAKYLGVRELRMEVFAMSIDIYY